MVKYFKFLFIFCLWCSPTIAIPKPEEVKNPLEKDHNHVKHYDENHHNVQYDHESFLGEDESKTFDSLAPEESRRRLGVIADKIDNNKDGFIDISELKSWIQYTQRRYIEDDVAREWKQHNPENNDTIKWEVYRLSFYGNLDELEPEELEREDHGVSYKKVLTRDRMRWSVADQNGDGELTKEEFAAFLHPEDHPLMRDINLNESIDDLDKDKDGKISIDEYIGDMYRSHEPDEEEPEWVVSERATFTTYRDLNGDGVLDKDEVREWLTPKDFEHSEAEAKHLVYEADANGDGKLTKEEILEKYDIFVGSQATDFGEALTRHDEF